MILSWRAFIDPNRQLNLDALPYFLTWGQEEWMINGCQGRMTAFTLWISKMTVSKMKLATLEFIFTKLVPYNHKNACTNQFFKFCSQLQNADKLGCGFHIFFVCTSIISWIPRGKRRENEKLSFNDAVHCYVFQLELGNFSGIEARNSDFVKDFGFYHLRQRFQNKGLQFMIWCLLGMNEFVDALKFDADHSSDWVDFTRSG